jgi:hypothetical protein
VGPGHPRLPARALGGEGPVSRRRSAAERTHQAHHYATGQHLLRLAQAHARQSGRVASTGGDTAGDTSLYAQLLKAFRDFVWESFVKQRVDDDPRLRFFFTILDAWTCGVAGVVDDEVLERGFDSINDLDLCEWLGRHGAKEVTLGKTPIERSPMLRAIYDLAFAYEDGDIRRPNAAAGTAAGTLLRLLFCHSGSILYKMQAGMGDAVFARSTASYAREG